MQVKVPLAAGGPLHRALPVPHCLASGLRHPAAQATDAMHGLAQGIAHPHAHGVALRPAHRPELSRMSLLVPVFTAVQNRVASTLSSPKVLARAWAQGGRSDPANAKPEPVRNSAGPGTSTANCPDPAPGERHRAKAALSGQSRSGAVPVGATLLQAAVASAEAAQARQALAGWN